MTRIRGQRRSLVEGYRTLVGGRCVVCNYLYEVHNNTGELCGFNTALEGHVALYKCSELNCNERYRGTLEDHAWEDFVDNENGTHGSRCSVCGLVKVEEHNFEAEESSTYSLRSANSTDPYGINFANEIKEEICVECGALASTANNGCEHNYVEKRDDYQHWEECTLCGYYKEGSLKEHSYGDYIDNGDGTHTKTCSECQYEIKNIHYYEEGICVDCNVKLEQGCEHTYTIKSDENNHWAECTKCQLKIDESLQEHEYDIYIDNEDGTHTAICNICSYKLVEEHTQDCEKCNNQENTDDEKDEDEKESNEDSKNEANNEIDNTVVKTEIPKAGKISFIALTIFVAIVVFVIKGKLNKYKDI